MDFLKRVGKALLFPHTAILWLALLLSPPMLVLAFLKPAPPLNYIAYALSAYTLTVWCVRIPRIVAWMKRFKNENRLVARLLSDEQLQLKASLYAALAFNIAYSTFQLALAVFWASLWYGLFSVYYLLLAIMRALLLRYNGDKQIKRQYEKYRFCGYLLILMNLTLSVIMFYIVARGRTFVHSEITAIALAAFTFAAFAIAIVNLIKYRKNDSPIVTASKIISLASACVSMLTLESTMLTAFGENDPLVNKLFMEISGGAVSVFITAMAVYMVAQGTKKLKEIKSTENNNER